MAAGYCVASYVWVAAEGRIKAGTRMARQARQKRARLESLAHTGKALIVHDGQHVHEVAAHGQLLRLGVLVVLRQ
jgi:hypothetical protein